MLSRKTTRAARMPSIPRELLDQIEQQGPMTVEDHPASLDGVQEGTDRACHERGA